MDLTSLQQTAALLFAVSFAGALLPLYRRWSERSLHVLVSISAGIFLGTTFLNLLPSLAGIDAGGHLHAADDHAEPTLAPWIAALVGLLLLFFVEKVWLKRVAAATGADPHVGLWIATYVGLSLHALTEGVALNSVLAQPSVLLASILIHKATETFSLATVMRLANLGNARVVGFLALFAAMQPLGLVLGASLAGHGLDLVLTGFACGTFLYVAVCDLLPEVFHGIDRPILKIASVVFGILLTTITHERLLWAGELFGLVGRESLVVFLDLAPYLLLGFLIAGVLRQVIRPEWLVRRLARDDLKSITLASLVGAPLPLCSCSVVPVAVSMHRAGASKGATTAFLIATPETGIDSVTVSWALLDPFLTIARPIGAIVSAISSGAAVNWLVRRGLDDAAVRPREPARTRGPSAHADRSAGEDLHTHPHAGHSGGHAQAGHAVQAGEHARAEPAHEVPRPREHEHEHEHTGQHGHEHEHEHAGHAHAGHAHAGHEHGRSSDADRRSAESPGIRPASARGGRVERVLHYAFVEMLDDLAPSLVVSVLLSGLIAAVVPAEVFESPLAHGFSGLLLMLVVGIPLYVCAAASTPIAAALILKGLSPGAAFVFLLAGPATNLGSMFVLARQLGTRVVLVQLAALAVVTLALGWAVDRIYVAFDLAPTAGLGSASELADWITYPCAALLALLLAVSIGRRTFERVVAGRHRAVASLAADRR